MYKRFFLNAGSGTAWMAAEVRDTVKGKRHLDANVSLSDCARQIQLDFDCDKKTRAARLRKIRSIIRTLQEVESAIAGYEFGKGDRDYL